MKTCNGGRYWDSGLNRPASDPADPGEQATLLSRKRASQTRQGRMCPPNRRSSAAAPRDDRYARRDRTHAPVRVHPSSTHDARSLRGVSVQHPPYHQARCDHAIDECRNCTNLRTISAVEPHSLGVRLSRPLVRHHRLSPGFRPLLSLRFTSARRFDNLADVHHRYHPDDDLYLQRWTNRHPPSAVLRCGGRMPVSTIQSSPIIRSRVSPLHPCCMTSRHDSCRKADV